MSDPPLSTLCSICHVKPHKYRCPRCSTLTCSLPCIKRHKQWAQCNGVRDPSRYIKHKDLATPKGIDHDYNYLTSIERELDSADRNATSRGVVLEEKVRSKGRQYDKGEYRLKNALEECGVIVVKAPKGMSRSKQNATHWVPKSKTLRWTVEWVHPDGKITLGRCPENQPIAEAYEAHLDSMEPARPSKRRKLNKKKIEAPTSTSETKLHSKDSNEPSNTEPTDGVTQAADKKSNGKPPIANSPPDITSNQAPQQTKTLDRSSSKNKIDEITNQLLSEWRQELAKKRPPEGTHPDHTDKSTDEKPQTNEDYIKPAPPPLTFHLHHPSLPSPLPVLIPLSPTATLSTVLTNRLILEFPTIYVLHQRPENILPDKYISEEEFFKSARKELRWVEEVEEGEVRGVEVGVVDEGSGGVDERRLMEVLGRDLGGGRVDGVL